MNKTDSFSIGFIGSKEVLVMEEKLVKSESNFSLHMDGESSIDAELL